MTITSARCWSGDSTPWSGQEEAGTDGSREGSKGDSPWDTSPRDLSAESTTDACVADAVHDASSADIVEIGDSTPDDAVSSHEDAVTLPPPPDTQPTDGADASEAGETTDGGGADDGDKSHDAGRTSHDRANDGGDADDGDRGRDEDVAVDAGLPGDGGRDGDGGGSCAPAACGTHSWACWVMPNAVGLGLPNEASYTDLGDGTMMDNRTCLVWEKRITSSSTPYSFEEAQTRCKNPQFPGSGWRVPTRIELVSIVDDSRVSPSVDIAAFPSTPYDRFWTASPYANDAALAWTVLFYDGTIAPKSQTGSYYGRCVRGNGEGKLTSTPPPNHYGLGSSEVRDNYTKLAWQERDSQLGSTALMTWEAAMAYCAGLNLNGHTWRLPTIKELATLVYDTPPTAQTVAVDTSVFGTMAAGYYWSSSRYARQPAASGTYPWVLNFADGSTDFTQSAALAKCVR